MPASLAVGDLNADGNADLVAADQNSDQISVLVGNGDGTFQPAVAYDAGITPESAVLGDFNSDGHLDVAVANYNGGYNVSVLLGNGDGTFVTPTHYGSDLYSTGIVTGDFNGDGKLDLAVSVSPAGPGYAAIFFGNGGGTFQRGTDYLTGPGAQAITVADLNMDGVLDLIVANEALATSNLTALLGKGDGTFASAGNFSVGQQPDAVTAVDVDGDGTLDLVTANNGDGSVSVLLGNGDGTFQPKTQYIQGGLNATPLSLAVADITRDGRPDFAIANYNSGQGSIGIMLGATVSLDPLYLAFPNEKIGSTSAPITVTLTNTAKTTLAISAIAIAGTAKNDFSQSNTCGATVASGGTCTTTVTFTPLAAGNRTAALRVSDNGSPNPQQAVLAGIGMH